MDILSNVKNRQERLIFIFTLVTVIFLPLSSVAAIFGMNTTDIRDLDWNQGLFWAVALPVTALVLFLAFWWPDSTPSLWEAWRQSSSEDGALENKGGNGRDDVDVMGIIRDAERDTRHQYRILQRAALALADRAVVGSESDSISSDEASRHRARTTYRPEHYRQG
jgi:hypothetical protein